MTGPMRNAAITAASLLTLAACSPEIPDSGAHANRTATTPVEVAPLGAADTAAAVLGVERPTATPPNQPQPPATGAPLTALAPGAATAAAPGAAASLSDEQSFEAVAARETIASDAERIDANRAQYVVIEPTELPPRPDGTGASIVAYALATTNVPGQALYRRSGIAAKARFERSCAKYGRPDLAQEAFLDAGGPTRDRYGMDPDGDGFACFWDPRPFREARGGAPEVVTEYEVIETPGDS